MKKVYYILLTLTFILGFSSCKDEILLTQDSDLSQSQNELIEGEPLSVLLEDPGMRTRNVVFGQGVSVRVNTYWLGVFDSSDGTLVAKYNNALGYKFLTSGEVTDGIIHHNLPKPSNWTSEKKYFMVAILNYSGVLGRWASNPSQTDYISNMLNQVGNWSDFNSIGVDTYSAYYDSDEEDSGHSSDAPMMAGFLIPSENNKNTSGSHIKIDQFASTGNVNLLPSGALENISFEYNNVNGKYNTAAYTLWLRRLVADINVNITPGNNVEITNITYKCYNKPTAVYIIERDLLDNDGYFPTIAEYSPNFADGDPTNGYTSDDYWNTNVTQTTDDSGKRVWNFSFQHFANKHWARPSIIQDEETQEDQEKYITDYAGREVIHHTKDGKDIDGNDIKIPYFQALCNGDESDFNNYASYFVIKMHIIDKVRNRCAEAEYIIHEGFTSNEAGTESTNLATIAKDFSCARNVKYTYNIHVEGIDNLFYNVNGGTDSYLSPSVQEHRADQQGRIWEFHYINEKIINSITGQTDSGYYFEGTGQNKVDHFKKYLSGARGEYPQALTLDSQNPNFAFRIYGYNSSVGHKRIEGFNFNFSDESFAYLDGMWPAAAGDYSHYYQDYNALVSDYLLGFDPEANEELFGTVLSHEPAFREFFQNAESAIDGLLFNAFKLKAHEVEGNARAPHIGENGDLTEEIILLKGVDSDGNATAKMPITIPLKINMNEEMDLVTFMRAIHYLTSEEGRKSGKTIPESFDLIVSQRDYEILENDGITENEKGVRCLYFTDRNGTPDPTDGCTTLIKVMAAIQGVERLP